MTTLTLLNSFQARPLVDALKASSLIRRSFSTSDSTFNSPSTYSHLKVNSDRLHDSLHRTCQWGALPNLPIRSSDSSPSGMRRLSLDDNDKKVRDWFVKECQDLGCTIKIDEMGNIFSTLPGQKEGSPVAIASHLDTQPSGGRYDGILGIHSALEIFRVLKENSFVPKYPLCIINWTNEEGARFPQSVISSNVWAGKIKLREAWDLKEIKDLSETPERLKSVREELERIGYLGKVKCDWNSNPIKAHFELHIEQGPILETRGKKVGIVKGGQAYAWFRLDLKGRESHTGTTPLELRSDPLYQAGRLLVASRDISRRYSGVISTGVISSTPGSINTIPGNVSMTLDFRHSSNEELKKMISEFKDTLEKDNDPNSRVHSKPLQYEMVKITETDSVLFDKECIECVRESSEEIVGKDGGVEIISGAGHDSFATSLVCPTTMIFVPSKDGISHNPAEFTSKDDCAIGAQVLLGAVLRYDAKRVD